MLSKKYLGWEEACWVRRGPRYQFDDRPPAARTYFPRGLVPYADEVERLFGPETLRTVLIQRLYAYLRFTELLELKSINHVGHQIALGELSVPVSADLRSRAFLLVRDEAHHATVSDDIARQVEYVTGVARLTADEPGFLRSLGEIAESAGRDLTPLIETAFASVSETLISGSLAQIPKDPDVVAVVRDYTATHAIDEARHQSYFSEFFTAWWPQLPLAARERLGPLLPDLCLAFLSPDCQSHQRVLDAAGVPEKVARDLVLAAFPPETIGPSVQRPLQVTLRMFERTGVFEDRRTHDVFAARGIL